MANVFISHNSADNDWAQQIFAWLEQDGHRLFLDTDLDDGLAVGTDWERRLFERLRWADAVVCVVSPNYVGSIWCAAEIGASMALGVQLLPVSVGGNAVQHKMLETIQGVDAVKDPDAACAALRSRLKVIAGGGGWGWPDGKPPYPGLRAFELGDHRVFFGRTREIVSLTKRLRSSERAQPAILLVVGASGSGKSSLVRAGVLPRVAGEDYWLALPPFVPGTDPLENLSRVVAEFALARNIPVDTHSLRNDLEHYGLKTVADDVLLAAAAPARTKLLVVIDQFEELLTQTGPDERSKFVTALAPALGGPVQVLATMRSEYVDALGKDPDLMNVRTRIYQVRPLGTDALRAVIEEPAAVAGLSFEDDLVTRLIGDTGTGDALPLLAFTLEQLVADAGRGDVLTHRRYDEIGGVQGALQRQADEALATACEVTGKSPDEVIDELLNLVTIDEHGRPSKRRLILEESPDPEVSLRPFLERRLLTTEVDGKTTSITVSHDAFLVNWRPLNKEIDAEVTALRTRRVVEMSAQDWEANGRDPAVLLLGLPLTKAIVDTGATFDPAHKGRLLTTRVDLNDSAREFLAASEGSERAKRARVRTKRLGLVALLVVVTLVAVLGAGVAFRSRHDAKDSQREAIAQKLIAEARIDLSKAVDTEGLQRLLVGRSLAGAGDSDETLYPVVVGSASTSKIMQNPHRPDGDELLPVKAVAVSPDGELIASGSNEKTLRMWDARTGAPLPPLNLAGPGQIGALAFDPSSRRIAAGGNDGSLQVLDVASGNRIGTLMQHPGSVSTVSFGHGGQWIATGDSQRTVRIWSVSTGRTIATVPGSDAGSAPVAKSVSFSPTADVVAVANGYGVRLVAADSGQTLVAWGSNMGVDGERQGYPITSVAFDNSGERLVVGGYGGSIDLLDGHSLKPMATRRAHPAVVNSLAFSADNSRIVSGGDDSAVKVWDATSLTGLGDTFRGHDGAVSSVAFTQDGTRIVSGSLDGTVRIWNAVFGLSIPANQGESVNAVDFSPDNTKVASGGVDGTVKLWDTRTAALISTLGQPAAPGDAQHAINRLAYYANGDRIVSVSNDGQVLVWNTETGSATKLDIGPRREGMPVFMQPRMTGVAVDPAEKYIAAGGFDGLVRLWDADSLRLLDVMSAQTTNTAGAVVPYQVWSVAFSPDGAYLATGSGNDRFGDPQNLVQIWDVHARRADGEPLRGASGQTVLAVDFVDDSKLVSGNSDGTIRVWDMNRRSEIPKPLYRDQSAVYSLAVLHRVPWIAAGGGGGIVRVWDIMGVPPEDTPLEGHQDWVRSVAVSSDDTLIVSASAEGDLRLWPGPSDVREALCRKLTVNPTQQQWDSWVQHQKDYEELCPHPGRETSSS
ncbi:nSTAND1 domain-containing NTPase [Mycolicibacterium psychrotolerans]|uniref:TIR domain-containing protein n=1 Tax=Mycolicibacterium psychrotolerans TaxID=216929 RepID=A0A7I7MIW6_9MYCO|nr:TIR domain-containing protein [Mycolicibacterium psychrotolerans]BBX72076.1 hypothetical protein MPSYJ_55370 [Mycolicibacterium psychrotolerans]